MKTIGNSYSNEVLVYKLSPEIDAGSILLFKANRNFNPVFGYEVCDILEAIVYVHQHHLDYLF